jgi:hypothetical protein
MVSLESVGTCRRGSCCVRILSSVVVPCSGLVGSCCRNAVRYCVCSLFVVWSGRFRLSVGCAAVMPFAVVAVLSSLFVGVRCSFVSGRSPVLCDVSVICLYSVAVGVVDVKSVSVVQSSVPSPGTRVRLRVWVRTGPVRRADPQYMYCGAAPQCDRPLPFPAASLLYRSYSHVIVHVPM